MKDPDFEGCQFLPLPPDEERRQLKKKRSSATIKLVLVIAGLALVAAVLTWATQRNDPSGRELENARSYFKEQSFVDEDKERRGLSLFGTLEPCPELGPRLQWFDPRGFEHIRYRPQCLSQVKPTLTLFTRAGPEQGCTLASKSTFTEYLAIQRTCIESLQGLPKVVFLVHGLKFMDTSLDEYLNMKTKIINHEDVGVVLVDWTAGSGTDFNRTLESLSSTTSEVLEAPAGVGEALPAVKTVGIASAATRLLSDIANLDFYHQAASNTRYMGAALANVSKHIVEMLPTKPKFHCIGHSLGAHVCGFMGKALVRINAPPLDRITGLDPAGPLFLQSRLAEMSPIGSTATHLTASDADLVDTIHTDSTWLGSFDKTGDLDFYVGGRLENEVKFGYDQAGALCFDESHSLSKKIFMSTISEECIQETVCSKVEKNRTLGCQSQRLNFGYNIDASWHDTTYASVPVNVNSSIICANGKRITVPGNRGGSGLKARSKLCTFIKKIPGTIRKVAKLLEHIFKSSEERIQAFKREIDDHLAQLVILGSNTQKDQKDLEKTYKELRESDLEYQNEKLAIKVLASRTKKTTDRIITVVGDILNPNVKTKGSDIRRIVQQVRSLLKKSNEKLPEAQTSLENIARRYGKILDSLKASQTTVDKLMEQHNISRQFVHNKRKEVKAEQGTTGDAVQIIVAIAGVFAGMGVAIYVDQNTGVNLMSGGGVAAVMQAIEEKNEKQKLELLDQALEKLNSIDQDIKRYSSNLKKANDKILVSLEDIKKRRAVLNDWLESVEDIWDLYEMDDYNMLEEQLREGDQRDLEDIRTNFQGLNDIAVKYLAIPDIPRR